MPSDIPSSSAPADADLLFEAFCAARDSAQMLALIAAASDDALDALERDVEARLAAAPSPGPSPEIGGGEGVGADALRERLQSLRSLRAEHADAIRQMRDQMRGLAEQLATLSPDEQLLLAFTSAQSTADIMRLIAATPDDALDRLEALVEAPSPGPSPNLGGGGGVGARLADLRRWRAAELETRAFSAAELGEHLAAIQLALAELNARTAQIRSDQLAAGVQHAAEIAGDPNLDVKHKLKVTIPILPAFLAYEGELELSSGLKLSELWRGVWGRLRRA